jgi:hypothetical protein
LALQEQLAQAAIERTEAARLREQLAQAVAERTEVARLQERLCELEVLLSSTGTA